MAVQRILQLVTHKTIYPDDPPVAIFERKLSEIDDGTDISWEKTVSSCMQDIEDLKGYLKSGQEKVTFGAETDKLLSKFSEPDCQTVFAMSLKKLEDHFDKYPHGPTTRPCMCLILVSSPFWIMIYRGHFWVEMSYC